MRQTGRTQRMLNDALQQAKEGRAVYILCAHASHRNEIQKRLGKEGEQLGIKAETPASFGESLDWRTLTMRGAHPNCVLLVDHFAIEHQWPALVEALHRYDLKQSS